MAKKPTVFKDTNLSPQRRDFISVIAVPKKVQEMPSRVNVELQTEKKPETTVETLLAQQVVALIEAEDISSTQALRAFPPLSPTVRERIKVLLNESYVPADIQRATLRAARFKMFMEAMDTGLVRDEKGGFDIGALKIAAEMSKQIGADPEIGLSQPPQQLVNIDIRGLAGVLETLEPLPGFKKKESDAT